MKKRMLYSIIFIVFCSFFISCSKESGEIGESKENKGVVSKTSDFEENESIQNEDGTSEENINQENYMRIEAVSEENGITMLDVTAIEIDGAFVIDIVLPDNYDSSQKYPVVYITDGNWRREDYADIKALSNEGSMLDVILVGICYPDYFSVDEIRVRDLLNYPDNFLRFIVKGIIPYINKNYNTNTDNETLWGASYGGYFTLYSVLQSYDLTKDVFENYVFASPTFWCSSDNKTLFDYEKIFYENSKKLDVNIYMTVGGLEGEYEFLEPFAEFDEIFKSRNYEGLNYITKIYAGKDHYTVSKPTMLDGFQLFLPSEK